MGRVRRGWLGARGLGAREEADARARSARATRSPQARQARSPQRPGRQAWVRGGEKGSGKGALTRT